MNDVSTERPRIILGDVNADWEDFKTYQQELELCRAVLLDGRASHHVAMHASHTSGVPVMFAHLSLCLGRGQLVSPTASENSVRRV
jgi:hypothetical protein